MIYDFSHYPTAVGRRVRFTMDSGDYRRALELPNAEALELAPIATCPTAVPGAVCLECSPAVARVLAGQLSELGGDAAIAARMLADALEVLVLELRRSRATERPAERRKVPA